MASDERIVHEERRIVAGGIVAHGTLACPSCDAPVALAGDRVTPRDVLACPFCDHHGLARDFLSLATPGRPARVVVRIRLNRAKPSWIRVRPRE
jgi:hypothetical protein